jgi:hypothetical protein
LPGAEMVCGNPDRERDRAAPVRQIELVDPEPKWTGGRYGVVGYEALYGTESAV